MCVDYVQIPCHFYIRDSNICGFCYLWEVLESFLSDAKDRLQSVMVKKVNSSYRVLGFKFRPTIC